MRPRRNESRGTFGFRKPTPKLESFVVCGAAAIPLLFWLYLFSLGARNLWRGHASAQWPVTRGIVVGSDTARTTSENPEDHTTSVSYSAKIALRYRVHNRDYTTENIYFGQTVGSGDSSEAEIRRIQYPIGAEVAISYDPENPSISVVKTGIHADAFWLPGAGLAFALPGIMVPFLFLTKAGHTPALGIALGIALGVFALAFCTIGILMLMAGLTNLWRAHASTNWPVASGAIVYGILDSTTSVSRNTQGNVERTTTHAARLVYEYTVEVSFGSSNC